MPEPLDFPDFTTHLTAFESGRYVYSGADAAAGISEHWEKYALPDGEHLIVSTRTVQDPAVTLRVQTRHFGDQLCEAWFDFDGETRVRANYLFADGGHLLLRHQVGDNPITEEKLDASECGLLFPLLRVYTGPMLREILDDGGSAQVLVPRLDCVDEPENLLRASVSERSVETAGPAQIELDGRPQDCEALLFRGGPYIDGAKCWLDGDLLLAYEWQQSDRSRWRVTLAP